MFKRQKQEYKEYEIYTEEEINHIFHLLDEYAPLRNRVFIKFAFTGGFRRGELLAIDESDLFFDKNQVRIDEALQYTKKYGYRFKAPKNKSFRTITLPAAVMQEAYVLLKEIRKNRLLLRELWVGWKEDKINSCYLERITGNHSIPHPQIHGGSDLLKDII
ncbi:tyrosine-type recombinase/integrase [Bacillus nakamurai]|uniref:tyrosine-type recombinase/integrase n=1 Tax=Bacillus nakamurai TaxID=1793963 RepID=UPI00227D841F|nr:tyrosine-type recombinase/integrase [Bacillus nakamurai]